MLVLATVGKKARAVARRGLALALAALGLGTAGPALADGPEAPRAAEAPAAPVAPSASWCAGGLETLPNEVCAFVPAKVGAGPRTLVIFLHGVIEPTSTWQWAQQLGAARLAARHGFTMIAPRGRRGTGPKGMEDWWTWPTAGSAQKTLEDTLVDEWTRARAELERRAGKPFERVFVFGFSNGAYYATSLAMRARLPFVDGYAAFAGGSGATYLRQAGARTKQRTPLYVGWGHRDRDRRDPEALAKMLRALRWPSKARGAKGVGHAMTDAQADEAVAFLSRGR
jgi:predicted esterase